ncbi:hypothetical protein ACE198_17125 [Neobacillus sp. KR4-4]|uniref:hypothetical protein n=1 Tax=Neobacillus sp. KR4-4 TaxID=3344872 RepID=UPI0035CB2F10
MSLVNEIKKNVSFIDQFWNQSFQIIDDWDEGEEYREEVLLQSIKQVAEKFKQNQTNVNELISQMTKELFEWEEMSRDQLLTSTTVLNNLLLINSFEEINIQVNQIKNLSSDLLTSPLNNLVKSNYSNTIINTLEKYIEYRRNYRNLFVKNIKETFSIILKNQRTFLSLLTNPIENVLFPFNKYMVPSMINK